MNSSKILLIEHNQTHRQRLSDILHKKGHEVLETESADEALQCILAGNGLSDVEFILLDLHLPDASALETVNFLRGHLPHVPIVGLWETPDFNLSCVLKELGVHKFLYKTVDIQLLLKTLAAVLPRENPADA